MDVTCSSVCRLSLFSGFWVSNRTFVICCFGAGLPGSFFALYAQERYWNEIPRSAFIHQTNRGWALAGQALLPVCLLSGCYGPWRQLLASDNQQRLPWVRLVIAEWWHGVCVFACTCVCDMNMYPQRLINNFWLLLARVRFKEVTYWWNALNPLRAPLVPVDHCFLDYSDLYVHVGFVALITNLVSQLQPCKSVLFLKLSCHSASKVFVLHYGPNSSKHFSIEI